MAFLHSSQVHGESQIAQTIGLDELPTTSQSQPSQRDPKLPWGRLFPLNFLFGDSPHSLWDDLITVGRAEDCTIVLEKTKKSSKGKILTDVFYKAYSKLHFQLTRNYTSTGCFTFIEDCSSNGTYVNGCKLGKGSKQFLSNNDEIAICEVKNRLFVYMETVDEKENIQMPKEIDEQFTIGKILGTGAYGEVRLGFHKTSCRRVAVKIISKDQLWGLSQSQETDNVDARRGLTPTLQTQREIEILRTISHPCVVSVEAVAESALAFYVVLELAEGGDLHTRLRNAKQPIGEKLAKIFFLQIASAVDYLHRNQVTHRDLKPENILLMTLDQVTVCKVTDFGLAKLASTMSSMTTFCGTPLFVAPEVIVAQGNSSYTSAVDLWALGVLLYLCLVSELPFRDGRGDLPLSQQILRGNYAFLSPRWTSISSSAKDLIRQFLQVNPNRRITAGEALHAQWLDDDDAKVLVDNLVHAPRPDSPLPQLMAKPPTSGRQGRSVTPTVVESRSSDEAKSCAAGQSKDANTSKGRDANGNRLNQAEAAVDRPVETIVAAANYTLKRRSACLHQSSSGESAESGGADGYGRSVRDKRMRIDP